MEISFSSSSSQAALAQQVSLAMTKKTLDVAKQKGEQTVEMLQASHPTLGKTIDIKV